MNLGPNLLKKMMYTHCSLAELLPVFVSWANYRHLYSNARVRTESRYGWQLFCIAEVRTFPQASLHEKWENLDYSLWISLRLIILIHHDQSCWQYWKKRCAPKRLQLLCALSFLWNIWAYLFSNIYCILLEMQKDSFIELAYNT